MKFNELLPVGSVVLLKDAMKKLVIIGVMPVKHTENGKDVAYDYIGVPYPEGYLGQESAMLFNHDSIAEISFMGYSNDERKLFIETIQKMLDETDAIITKREK